MTIWIYTGGRPSNSAKALASQPGFRRLRTGKLFKHAKDVIINWGSSKDVPVPAATVYNDPQAVGQAANKFYAFGQMTGNDVDVVPWTANKAVAQEWQDSGATIVVRQKLTGHSNDGIIIVEKGEEIPDAPLYTKYIFKTKEFRVHATRFKVIDTQRKVRDPDQEPKTWKVRSHANGFIFQRQNIEEDLKRDALACAAVHALGLDFGAVDIIEDKKGNLYVLEVNTAPGLEGQTIDLYTQALKELVTNA